MSSLVFPSKVRGLSYTVLRAIENSVIRQESPSFASNRILQSQNPRWHWSLNYEFLHDGNPSGLGPNPNYVYTDLQTMLGFIAARSNDYDDFLFDDPDSDSVGPGVITNTVWLPNYSYPLGTILIGSSHAQQVIKAPAGARSGLNPTGPVWNTSGGTTVDGGLTWQDLGASISYPNPQAQLQLVTDGNGNWYAPLQINQGGQFYEDVFDINGAPTIYDNGQVTTNYTLGFGGLSFSGFSSGGMYAYFGYVPTGPITASFNYYRRVIFEDPKQEMEKWANQWWAIGGGQSSRGAGDLKLMSSPLPGGAPGALVAGAPPPPFNPPPGLNSIIIYPTRVVITQGTFGIGFGNPKNSSIEIVGVTLAWVSPTVTFSGYVLPPSVPQAAVRQVNTYFAGAFQPNIPPNNPTFSPTYRVDTRLISTNANLNSTIQGGTVIPSSLFYTASIGVPIVSNVEQVLAWNASLGNTYSVPLPLAAVAPALIVYY